MLSQGLRLAIKVEKPNKNYCILTNDLLGRCEHVVLRQGRRPMRHRFNDSDGGGGDAKKYPFVYMRLKYIFLFDEFVVCCDNSLLKYRLKFIFDVSPKHVAKLTGFFIVHIIVNIVNIYMDNSWFMRSVYSFSKKKKKKIDKP